MMLHEGTDFAFASIVDGKRPHISEGRLLHCCVGMRVCKYIKFLLETGFASSATKRKSC